jgi:hypothetical protein
VIRLGRAREHAAPAGGELERVAEHPLDAAPRNDTRLHGYLGRQAAVRPASDSGVLAFGVLAEEEHVDVSGDATRQRARDPLQQPCGADIRPEIEPLAELEHETP